MPGHEVIAVYSQPPRPDGRGMERPEIAGARAARRSRASRCARRSSLQERRARPPRSQALQADVAVVAAYGLILPKAILDAPRHGCLNIHASLLPRWRGAAPIQRAIMAGDAETGVTIMQMEEGLDTGPMLLKEELADRRGHECRRAARCAGGDRRAPDRPGPGPAGRISRPCRSRRRASPTPPRSPRRSAASTGAAAAAELDRQIRGLSPAPGAFTEIDGERLTILAADPVSGSGAPGTIIDDRLTIACGEGALRPTLVKRAGKRAMSAEEMLRGFAVPKGTALS